MYTLQTKDKRNDRFFNIYNPKDRQDLMLEIFNDIHELKECPDDVGDNPKYLIGFIKSYDPCPNLFEIFTSIKRKGTNQVELISRMSFKAFDDKDIQEFGEDLRVFMRKYLVKGKTIRSANPDLNQASSIIE